MMENGVQCVTTAGTLLRPRWCVVSFSSLEQKMLSLGRTTDQVPVTSVYSPPGGSEMMMQRV